MNENLNSKISEIGGTSSKSVSQIEITERDIEQAEKWIEEAPICSRLESPYFKDSYIQKTLKGFRFVNTKIGIDFNGVPKDLAFLSIAHVFAEIRHYYENGGVL